MLFYALEYNRIVQIKQGFFVLTDLCKLLCVRNAFNPLHQTAWHKGGIYPSFVRWLDYSRCIESIRQKTVKSHICASGGKHVPFSYQQERDRLIDDFIRQHIFFSLSLKKCIIQSKCCNINHGVTTWDTQNWNYALKSLKMESIH